MQHQQKFNSSMSKVRINIEWTFWPNPSVLFYLDIKKNTKLLLESIGNFYLVATILTNRLKFLSFYGSLTSTFSIVDHHSLHLHKKCIIRHVMYVILIMLSTH